MTAQIEIKGIEEIERKLGNVPSGVKAAIKAAALHVKGKIAQYPPSTGANAPRTYMPGGQNRWYERGWGSKWALSGGGWHGNKTSETLGRKWTIKSENGGLTAIVGNNVSYGPYVQGADEQAQALKRIGWKTTKQVAEEENDTVVKFVQQEIEKALSK